MKIVINQNLDGAFVATLFIDDRPYRTVVRRLHDDPYTIPDDGAVQLVGGLMADLAAMYSPKP